jgi:hypothetical protein
MTKSEIEKVIKEIETILTKTNEMWKQNVYEENGPSKDFIIGYLQGSLLSLKNDLNLNIDKTYFNIHNN